MRPLITTRESGDRTSPLSSSSYNPKCTGLPDTYALIIEQEGMPAVEALSGHIRHRWDRNQNIVEGVLTLVQLMGQLVAFWRAAPLHSVSVAVGTAGQAGYVAPVVQGQYAARHSPLAFYQVLAPLVDHLKGLFNYLDLKEREGVHMNATSLQLLAVKGADMSVTEQQRRISQQLATAAQHSNRSNGGGGAFHHMVLWGVAMILGIARFGNRVPNGVRESLSLCDAEPVVDGARGPSGPGDGRRGRLDVV